MWLRNIKSSHAYMSLHYRSLDHLSWISRVELSAIHLYNSYGWHDFSRRRSVEQSRTRMMSISTCWATIRHCSLQPRPLPSVPGIIICSHLLAVSLSGHWKCSGQKKIFHLWSLAILYGANRLKRSRCSLCSEAVAWKLRVQRPRDYKHDLRSTHIYTQK